MKKKPVSYMVNKCYVLLWLRIVMVQYILSKVPF